MNTLKFVKLIILFGLMISACMVYAHAESNVPDHFKRPSENLITGGQPSREDLIKLKEAGVTKIINLRGPDESLPFDEKKEASALGLEYVSFPIVGATDTTSANAKKLHELLGNKDKVFVHCVSGNRVGALLAIKAHKIEGLSVEDSLAFGRAAGLGSLEEKVKSELNNSSAPAQ